MNWLYNKKVGEISRVFFYKKNMASFIHSLLPACPLPGPCPQGSYHGFSGMERRVDANERACRRERGK